MLEIIKKQLKVQCEDWLGITVFIPGAWLLGIGLHYMIMRFDPTMTRYFPFGTILAGIAVGLCAFIMGTVQFVTYFNMEIGMGCTRAGFFVSYSVVSCVYCFIYVVVMLLLNLAEQILEKWMYPDLTCAFDLFPYLLKGCIPVMAAVCILSGFCGALFLRYGQKAAWVLWSIWMICTIGIPRIHTAAQEAPNSLFGWLGNKVGFIFSGFTVKEVALIGAVVSILCLIVTWRCLRRQQVTS